MLVVCPILPVTLDCPFSAVHSGFSNIDSSPCIIMLDHIMGHSVCLID